MKRFSGEIFVILAAVLWGMISLPSQSLARAGLTAMQITAARCTVACIALTPIMLTRPASLRIKLPDIWAFFGTGIVSLLCFNFCFFTAMRLNGVSTATALLYTAPAIVIALSAVFFGESITRVKIAMLFTTFIGCLLTAGLFSGAEFKLSATGIFAGLGAGLCYALYSIFSRVLINRAYSALTIAYYTFLLAATSALMLSDAADLFAKLGNAEVLISTLGIGILCCLLPYLLYTLALEKMPSGRAAMLATVEPIVAAIIGAAVFGERLNFARGAGFALIILSVLFVNTKEQAK